MKNLLLGIIAINLTFLSIITTLNYMQTAKAQGIDMIKVMICDPNPFFEDSAKVTTGKLETRE